MLAGEREREGGLAARSSIHTVTGGLSGWTHNRLLKPCRNRERAARRGLTSNKASSNPLRGAKAEGSEETALEEKRGIALVMAASKL